MTASGASEEDDKEETAIIYFASPHILKLHANLVWANNDGKNNPVKILEALEIYCNPRDNEVIESHRFWNIPYNESFDKFLTELRTRATSSYFQERHNAER